ncbi:hypothetical protein ACHAWF_016566 [Thalassiosira exigua]
MDIVYTSLLVHQLCSKDSCSFHQTMVLPSVGWVGLPQRLPLKAALIRNEAKKIQKRNLACWKDESFKLPSPDDPEKNFYLLEYSGSRQAAEDIERVRKLFGDTKLSLHGISYGTKIMSQYATMYPKKVAAMVLDGNDDSNSDIVENAENLARSAHQRVTYFTSVCSAETSGPSDSEYGSQCGIEDPSGCLNSLNKMIHAPEIKDDLTWNANGVMKKIMRFMYRDVTQAQQWCEIAEDEDFEELKKKLSPKFTEASDCATAKSQPTQDDCVFGNDGYVDIMGQGAIPQNLVTAQDYYMGAYDEDTFVENLMGWNKKYPAYGTQIPVGETIQWYAAKYHWPISTPLSPLGRPDVEGLIFGQMSDPFTPYLWTQKMRENFKGAHLLTSRYFNHGIASREYDSECYDHMEHYFETGTVDFSDGKTCENESLIGEACSIDNIARNQLCLPSTSFPTGVPTTYPPTFPP